MLTKTFLAFCVLCAFVLIGCTKTETMSNSNSTTSNSNKTTTTTTSTTSSTGDKVGVPECEFVVSSAAQRDAARFLPHCTLVELPESKHDPFLERDKIRDEWLCRIEAFLFEQLSLSLVPADVEQTVQTQAIKVVDKWVLAGRGAFTRRGIKHLRRSSG